MVKKTWRNKLTALRRTARRNNLERRTFLVSDVLRVFWGWWRSCLADIYAAAGAQDLPRLARHDGGVLRAQAVLEDDEGRWWSGSRLGLWLWKLFESRSWGAVCALACEGCGVEVVEDLETMAAPISLRAAEWEATGALGVVECWRKGQSTWRCSILSAWTILETCLDAGSCEHDLFWFSSQHCSIRSRTTSFCASTAKLHVACSFSSLSMHG